MACECGTKIQIAGNATVGDSLMNPFTAEWLYALNKERDWKCVDTNDGVNFNIRTTIEVGNGVVPTYFRDYGHNFTFDPGHNFVLNPPAYLEIGGNTDWTVHERNQIRDALGITGDKTTAVGGQLQDVSDKIDAVAVMLARALGMMQENFYIDNTVYHKNKLTSGRIRIYSDSASVGTAADVIATYDIAVTYNGDDMQTYKVVKA